MSPALHPRTWGVHLLMLVLLAAAIALGLWQLGTWQGKRDDKVADLTLATPVPITEVIGKDAPFPGLDVGRPVIIAGHWDAGSTIYVSGQQYAGRSGYWVVTPLVEQATGSAVPIVRGWVDTVAAAPAAPTGDAQLVAWLQPTEDTGQVDTDPTDDVLPELTIADLVQRTPQDLYGAYAVVATGVAPGEWPSGDRAVNAGTTGLEPAALDALPSANALTGLQNLLYAFQWWIFGGFGVYIWSKWVRDEINGGHGPVGDTTRPARPAPPTPPPLFGPRPPRPPRPAPATTVEGADDSATPASTVNS